MKKKYHEIPICHTFGRECTVEFPRFQSCQLTPLVVLLAVDRA
jgi:hypothetical protein